MAVVVVVGVVGGGGGGCKTGIFPFPSFFPSLFHLFIHGSNSLNRVSFHIRPHVFTGLIYLALVLSLPTKDPCFCAVGL